MEKNIIMLKQKTTYVALLKSYMALSFAIISGVVLESPNIA